jgi:exodeoxyribonuclease V alpha subunit
MVLRNDYVLKLFNGDVGIVLPDASGTLMVYFPESDGSFRAVAPLRLPEHETAFATTVHKAQGSEFDQVLLMLPAKPTRVVTRELVYTAVTRSRSGVTIVGGAEVLQAAIASPTRRYSGLVARLEESSAPPLSKR